VGVFLWPAARLLDLGASVVGSLALPGVSIT